MAEVVNNMAGLGSMPMPGAPRIEMVRNPDFSFPRQPQPTVAHRRQDGVEQRPSSMHMNLPPQAKFQNAHRRAVSTLPSFTFNAADTTGKQETPPETPPANEESAPITPSRRGHRRGGSEFVGGDSRFGVSNALSSSPTKASALPIPAPSAGTPSAGRRGHAHRRSAAMSSHDVSSIMHSTEPAPRLSQSLPNTPMEIPGQAPPLDRSTSAPDELADPFGPPLDSTSTRPPSRPRVGFDDNVVIIPRPLSTISSETESSISTMRGHSYNNSISSVISMSTPSPQTARAPKSPLTSTIEEQSSSRTKSSLEISRRIEKEGEWLRNRSPSGTKRPHSEMIMPSQITSFAQSTAPLQPVETHPKESSTGHVLAVDRRRSEPNIGGNASETTSEHVSSATRIKQWARRISTRKQKGPRDVCRPPTACSSEPSLQTSGHETSIPATDPETSVAAVAETNLDMVLGGETILSEEQRPGSQARADVSTPTPSQHSSFFATENDDPTSMLDLDAALGPFQTPQMGPQRQRKELHSSRLNKDFIGPGGHYHRRTESAPAMPPFESARLAAPSQSSMADVFEEEEDEDEETAPTVEIVDVNDAELQTRRSRAGSGLGIERAGDLTFATIVEEASPNSYVEIVHPDEEPRASSLTKSSDSSETPTVLAAPALLPIPNDPFMTPDTFQGSDTFTSTSSPDFGPRQSSFDTSRLGTSASSIAEQRTLSSYGGGAEPIRVSVDDVPSLTSSRSTMLSTAAPYPRQASGLSTATPASSVVGAERVVRTDSADRRRKRGSIQSLSQLVGGSFTGKNKGGDGERPQTSAAAMTVKKPKGERLKKLMFWKAKQKGQTM